MDPKTASEYVDYLRGKGLSDRADFDARLEASERVLKEIGVLIVEAAGRRPRRDLSDDEIRFGEIVDGYER